MRTLMVLVVLLGLAQAQVRSLYTDLAANKCKTLSLEPESESSTQQCPGLAGYRVRVEEGDLRQNLRLIPPGKKEVSLELWTVVSSAFSSLGPRAEWRVVQQNGKTVPIALILRYNASENPEDASLITSYLVVVKLIPGAICVTDKIKPGAGANLAAQKAADASANKACLAAP